MPSNFIDVAKDNDNFLKILPKFLVEKCSVKLFIVLHLSGQDIFSTNFVTEN